MKTTKTTKTTIQILKTIANNSRSFSPFVLSEVLEDSESLAKLGITDEDQDAVDELQSWTTRKVWQALLVGTDEAGIPSNYDFSEFWPVVDPSGKILDVVCSESARDWSPEYQLDSAGDAIRFASVVDLSEEGVDYLVRQLKHVLKKQYADTVELNLAGWKDAVLDSVGDCLPGESLMYEVSQFQTKNSNPYLIDFAEWHVAREVVE